MKAGYTWLFAGEKEGAVNNWGAKYVYNPKDSSWYKCNGTKYINNYNSVDALDEAIKTEKTKTGENMYEKVTEYTISY